MVAAAAAIGASYGVLRSLRLQRVERRIGLAFSRPLGGVADRLISAATDLGSVYAIAGSSAALAVAGRRRAATDVIGAGLTAWTVAQAVKPLTDRPRPFDVHGADRLVALPAGTSWPSGHVAVAASLAGAVTPELPRPARVAAWTTVGFVGVSRIYVGVHHPSDVVAGAGFGVLCARAWASLRRRVAGRRRRR